MAPQTTDRDRWLALGLLVAALVLAYFVLLHPWWTVPMIDAENRIDTLQERELRVRTQLRQAPDVDVRLAEVRRAQGERPGFLPETTPELATAGLVQRLEACLLYTSPSPRD